MIKEILNALTPIKEATGLEIDLYSSLGELLASTDTLNPTYEFCLHKPSEFEDNILIDIEQGITYFIAKKAPAHYIGVIMGANEVSRNYAIMVSKIIESTLASIKGTLDKTERFRLFLNGELNDIQINSLKSSMLQPFNYYVLSLITNSRAKQTELKNFLSAICEKEDIIVAADEMTLVYIKHCGDDDEYQSANDFAYILYDNIKEELRITLSISVGGAVHEFDDLILCYQHSLYAYNLGRLMDPNNNIFSYKEYVMLKLLSDIPKITLSQYLDVLLDKNSLEIIADDELMTTADVFLKNSLNISETSRNMYMHRNTLIYRLDKIEKATGLNIRHFADAVTFRLITILNKLVNSKDKS